MGLFFKMAELHEKNEFLKKKTWLEDKFSALCFRKTIILKEPAKIIKCNLHYIKMNYYYILLPSLNKLYREKRKWRTPKSKKST